MPVLEARHVSKRFRIPSVKRTTIREHVLALLRPSDTEDLTVLDDVSFAIERGQTLGIMGRNGSGKSTLLKILSGIYTADHGSVAATGLITPILELGVGWNPELDAVDNIMLLGSVMGLSLRDLRQGTEEILAFAELERFANLKLQHYSSGMALRLAYAVAFKAVRDILILDEIFAVGDAAFRVRCEARYKELHASGVTVIMVSHDIRVIRTFCQRALLIESGRLAVDGSPAQVADAYLALLDPSRASALAAT